MTSLKISYQGDHRRIRLETDAKLTYNDFLWTFSELFGETGDGFITTWTDEDGDKIKIGSDQELLDAMAIQKDNGLETIKFQVYNNRSIPEVNTAKNTSVHTGIACSSCGVIPIVGARYRNTQNKDQNLCEKCESKKSSDSAFIKIYNPDQKNIADYIVFKNPSLSVDISSPSGKFKQKSENLYKGRFIKDVTFTDGSVVIAGSKFIKIWRYQNDGSVEWPAGVSLVPYSGDELCSKDVRVQVKNALPSEEVDISIELRAPMKCGRYISYFRMQLPDGSYFGQRLWAGVNVIEYTPESQNNSGCKPQVVVGEVIRGVSEAMKNVIKVIGKQLPKDSISHSESSIEFAEPMPYIEVPIEMYGNELRLLTEMGFKNKDLIISVLKKHLSEPSNDLLDPEVAEKIQRVVYELFNSTEA